MLWDTQSAVKRILHEYALHYQEKTAEGTSVNDTYLMIDSMRKELDALISKIDVHIRPSVKTGAVTRSRIIRDWRQLNKVVRKGLTPE